MDNQRMRSQRQSLHTMRAPPAMGPRSVGAAGVARERDSRVCDIILVSSSTPRAAAPCSMLAVRHRKIGGLHAAPAALMLVLHLMHFHATSAHIPALLQRSSGTPPPAAPVLEKPQRSPCVAHRALSLRGLRGGDGEVEHTSEEKKEQEKMVRDKELIGQLQGMRNVCRQLKERINTVGDEIMEHDYAASVLEKFDGARPCKRAIGGVLIDSTAGEVLPAVRNEMKLLTKASEELTAKLRETEKELQDFQTEHDIRISPSGG